MSSPACPRSRPRPGTSPVRLPRVADLFEARRPKEPSILAEQSGVVSFGRETKGKQRIVITEGDEGRSHDTLVAKWRNILVNVQEGEHVELGETIVDGSPSAHDILRLLGVSALANYIVNEVQEVYRLQGVQDQRQAHRGHRPPDAAARRRSSIPEIPSLVPGEQVDRSIASSASTRRWRPTAGSWRSGSPCCSGSPEGVAFDRQLHLRGVVPGDHPSAHGSFGERASRRSARAQGERHRRASDSGGHRVRPAPRGGALPRGGDIGAKRNIKARFAEAEALVAP